MNPPRVWRYYVCLSLLIAVLACFLPKLPLAPSWPNTDLTAYVSVCLAVVWLAMLGGGLYRYRWRGLWILIGAPLALYYPYLFYSIARACSQNIKACP
jgi:hypothetical protein